MRHTIVKLTGLLMALALTLTGCNLIGVDPIMQLNEDTAKLEKDYAAVVAEYDGGAVTKGEALGRFASMYSYYTQMYSMFGMNMTADVVENVKQQSVEEVVESVAVQKELEKRGLSLSEEKQAEVEKTAADNYKSAYDSFYAEAEGKGEVKDAQTRYDMLKNGYTEELFRKTQQDAANHELLKENVEAEIAELTDEELQTAYDELVSEDQELYSDDASAFETAMSSSEKEEDAIIAWMPEGYRTVKHILVKPGEDVQKAFTDARTALSDAETALAGFETELADLNDADDAEEADDAEAEEAEAEETAEAEAEETAEPEPTEAPRTVEEIQADMDKAQADVDAAKKAVAEAEAKCLESVKDKTDEIYAKIEAGEDFEALIAEYGEDPGMQNEPTASRGYYVTAAKGNWDQNFNDAAMALENVGDVTMTPVVSSSGVHIIKYMSDVTGGAVALDDIRDKLYENTLSTKREEHYDETLTALVEALNPVYHMEAFNVE